MYTWPVDRTCLPEIDPEDAPDDVLRLDAAIDTAVFVLWSLTGRTFAIEDVWARPCPRWRDVEDYDAGMGFGSSVGFVPILDAGVWRNVSGCGGACTVDGMGAVTLPGPVTNVVEVRVDGTAIDPSSWKVEGNVLYRTNRREWPTQDMSLPMGDPGTWSVHYQRGVQPPAGAAAMVGVLAKEFWAICSGGKCRLPKRWQTIQRQGVTITRADPTTSLTEGVTGLPEIDTWIKAVNPHQLVQPSMVVSPDYSSRAR
jgi:hypothetical protein